MAQTISPERIMESVEQMEVKDEVRLLHLISSNLYKKMNDGSKEVEEMTAMSGESLSKIWDNDEDDVYNDLLKK